MGERITFWQIIYPCLCLEEMALLEPAGPAPLTGQAQGARLLPAPRAGATPGQLSDTYLHR